MYVRPSDSDPARRPPAPPLHAGNASAPAPPLREGKVAKPQPSAAASHAELSSEAQALFDRMHAAPPSGTIAAARARQVLGRLADGHYDRPDVLDALAARLFPDLAGPGSEQ
jgi:hypothetical protein